MNYKKILYKVFLLIGFAISCHLIFLSIKKLNNLDYINSSSEIKKNFMENVTYTYYYKGIKLLVLKAKRAEIKKKKVGFFRFGLFKELELFGLELDYFEPEQKYFDEKELSDSDDKTTLSDSLFCAGNSLSIAKNQIKGISAHNAKIRYNHKDKTITIIQSKKIDFGKNGKILQLNGHSVINCKNQMLISKNIDFIIKDKIFYVKNDYMLFKGKIRQKGKGIYLDLFLMAVNP